MKKFSKNIVTHQSTRQIPFLLDFLKSLLIVAIIALAIVGALSLISPTTREILITEITEFLTNVASRLGL